VFRPDWEAVVAPVIDFALTRPEIAADAIALFGYSLGGYLVARAAAFEHRVAALVLDDGIYDFHSAFARLLPPFLNQWVDEGRDEEAASVLAMLMAASGQVRWALNNGVWVMGAESTPDYLRRTKAYTLDGVAEQISCPTLVMDADNDQFLNGQPESWPRRSPRRPRSSRCANRRVPANTATWAPCPGCTSASSTGWTRPLPAEADPRQSSSFSGAEVRADHRGTWCAIFISSRGAGSSCSSRRR
jgi:pimeloyl-ACP methyl ester carboxylesterase